MFLVFVIPFGNWQGKSMLNGERDGCSQKSCKGHWKSDKDVKSIFWKLIFDRVHI